MTLQHEDATHGGPRWSAARPADEQRMDDMEPLSKEDEGIVALVHRRLIQDMDLTAVEKLGPERGR